MRGKVGLTRPEPHPRYRRPSGAEDGGIGCDGGRRPTGRR